MIVNTIPSYIVDNIDLNVVILGISRYYHLPAVSISKICKKHCRNIISKVNFLCTEACNGLLIIFFYFYFRNRKQNKLHFVMQEVYVYFSFLSFSSTIFYNLLCNIEIIIAHMWVILCVTLCLIG